MATEKELDKVLTLHVVGDGKRTLIETLTGEIGEYDSFSKE